MYRFDTILSSSENLKSLLFDFNMGPYLTITIIIGMIVGVYVALSVPSFLSNANDVLTSSFLALGAAKIAIKLLYLQPQRFCWGIQCHVK